MIGQLLQQMAGQKAEDEIPPHLQPIEVALVRELLARALDWLQKAPAKPEVGCLFRTYNGSLVFCHETHDAKATRFCMMVLKSNHAHFAVGEHYDVYPNGLPWSNKIDWMGLGLAENLGQPGDDVFRRLKGGNHAGVDPQVA